MINYAGDLFAITGAQLDAKRGIYRLRCTYGDCKWKPFGQKLKESRSMAVAIPVLDSLLNCTAPNIEQANEKKEAKKRMEGERAAADKKEKEKKGES